MVSTQEGTHSMLLARLSGKKGSVNESNLVAPHLCYAQDRAACKSAAAAAVTAAAAAADCTPRRKHQLSMQERRKPPGWLCLLPLADSLMPTRCSTSRARRRKHARACACVCVSYRFETANPCRTATSFGRTVISGGIHWTRLCAGTFQNKANKNSDASGLSVEVCFTPAR